MFLDDSACNLASLNLIKFWDSTNKSFLIDDYKHTIQLWTVVLEISVLMAHYPSPRIAQRSYEFRTLGLGFANLGATLMLIGVPYDSPESIAISGCLASLLTSEAYSTSALMAKQFGPFKYYEQNKEDMLRVIRNHRRAAYNNGYEEYEGLSIKPLGISSQYCPPKLLQSARNSWDNALELGNKYGYRNAQVTVIPPTGTISLVMDCDTTGIEPDYAIVKSKKLAGGGSLKIINNSIKNALASFGYSAEQIFDIEKYALGYITVCNDDNKILEKCPYINSNSLSEKGLSSEFISNLELQLRKVDDIRSAFNNNLTDDNYLVSLGLTKDMRRQNNARLLSFFGYSDDEIDSANEFIYGT